MTVLFILPKTVSFKKSVLLLYYLYCLCKSLQRSLLYVGFLFRKADAKVKTFKYIFQIFSEVFFHLSFFPSSLLRKGEQGKDSFYRPGFKKKCVNQRCLLFESGCKGKNFISYLPNVFGSFFFILLFQMGDSRKKQTPSRRNM